MGLAGFSALLQKELLRFLRIPTQTVVSPVVSAGIFLLVFGFFLGQGIGEVQGVDFIVFFVPGLMAFNLVSVAYSNSAFSLFISRFLGFIKDELVTPLSYAELILAIVLASVVRVFIIAGVIYLTTHFFFHAMPLHDPLLMLVTGFLISFSFACIGLIVGLWAEEFEKVEFPTIYVITPLTFLGGVFHSVSALPPIYQQLSWFNPLFHVISLFRYAVTGISEGSVAFALGFLVVMAGALFYANLYLFKKGWKLRT